jgi:hypothetical protein
MIKVSSIQQLPDDQCVDLLIEVIRNICNPLCATSHFISTPAKAGGLGFQDPTAEVDVQTITQAIKMLSSSDPFVSLG